MKGEEFVWSFVLTESLRVDFARTVRSMWIYEGSSFAVFCFVPCGFQQLSLESGNGPDSMVESESREPHKTSLSEVSFQCTGRFFCDPGFLACACTRLEMNAQLSCHPNKALVHADARLQWAYEFVFLLLQELKVPLFDCHGGEFSVKDWLLCWIIFAYLPWRPGQHLSQAPSTGLSVSNTQHWHFPAIRPNVTATRNHLRNNQAIHAKPLWSRA
jgi:hypothetical protein